jgi:hypothetical protein
VVGAPYESGSGYAGESSNTAPPAGAAYVFTRSNGAWSQQSYLKASNAEAHDNFARYVAISNNILVIGAPKNDIGGTVYTWQ